MTNGDFDLSKETGTVPLSSMASLKAEPGSQTAQSPNAQNEHDLPEVLQEAGLRRSDHERHLGGRHLGDRRLRGSNNDDGSRRVVCDRHTDRRSDTWAVVTTADNLYLLIFFLQN